MYLDGMQDALEEQRGVWVSIATLSRTLKSYNKSRKKIIKVAAQRNEELRAAWTFDYGDIPAD